MIPAPHALGVRRYQGESEDAHGNATVTYAAASLWQVHAIFPGALEELSSSRDATVVELTVLAAKSPAVPTSRDRVVVDGAEYEVVGEPGDWTRGPWVAPFAGVSVELRRVTDHG